MSLILPSSEDTFERDIINLNLSLIDPNRSDKIIKTKSERKKKIKIPPDKKNLKQQNLSKLYEKIMHEIEEIMEEEEMLGLQPLDKDSTDYEEFERAIGKTSTQNHQYSPTLYDRLKLRTQDKNISLTVNKSNSRVSPRKRTQKINLKQSTNNVTKGKRNMNGDCLKKNKLVFAEHSLIMDKNGSLSKNTLVLDQGNNESSGNLFQNTKKLDKYRRIVSKCKNVKHKTRNEKRKFKTRKTNNVKCMKSELVTNNPAVKENGENSKHVKFNFRTISTKSESYCDLEVNVSASGSEIVNSKHKNNTECVFNYINLENSRLGTNRIAQDKSNIKNNCNEQPPKSRPKFIWPNKAELWVSIISPKLKSKDLASQENELKAFYRKPSSHKDCNKIAPTLFSLDMGENHGVQANEVELSKQNSSLILTVDKQKTKANNITNKHPDEETEENYGIGGIQAEYSGGISDKHIFENCDKSSSFITLSNCYDDCNQNIELTTSKKGARHLLSRTKRLQKKSHTVPERCCEAKNLPELVQSNLSEGTTVDIIYRLMLSKCVRISGYLIDIKPSLQGGTTKNAIIWNCNMCKNFYKYTEIKKLISTKLLALCPMCSEGKERPYIKGELHFEFIVKDLKSCYHMYLLVGKEAESFFRCSTYNYLMSREVRKCVQTSIRRLLRSHQKQVLSEFCLSTRNLFTNGPKYLVNVTHETHQPE